jgi:hypothetical protein
VIARTLSVWLVQDSSGLTKTTWRNQVKDCEVAVSMTWALLMALRSGNETLSKTKAPA